MPFPPYTLIESDLIAQLKSLKIHQTGNSETVLPMEPFHLAMERAAASLRPKTIANATRSAFRHLRKAWGSRISDPDMAVFRMITAEEEAASALIRALKQRKYTNAKAFNERHHAHKSAIWPFIEVVGDYLHSTGVKAPHLHFAEADPPRLELEVTMRGPDGNPVYAKLDEPFNFVMRSGPAGEMTVHDFSNELSKLAASKGRKKIKEHIDQVANQRNILLYASEKGIASTTATDEFLLSRRMRITCLVAATIAVMQSDTHQAFVVQLLIVAWI